MRGLRWLCIGAALLPLFSFALNEDCEQHASLACARAPTSAFDAKGDLWVVFEQNGQLFVTRSVDLGHNFSTPVAVNTTPERIYAKGENRPKLTFGKDAWLYVSWTQKTPGRYTGNIRFSRSSDGGRSFTKPYTVNDDGLNTSHRFDALYVAPSGRIYLAWLDKRDRETALAAGNSYPGAALYYAVSDNAGQSFSPNYKVADNSCECCRIAIAAYGKTGAAILWRHIFDDSTRDHAFALLDGKLATKARRATVDEWQINACPHHGPHMVSGDGEGSSYHMAWFSNGKRHKGLYYGRYHPATSQASTALSLDSRAGAGHPQIAVQQNRLTVIWKVFDGTLTSLQMMRSEDAGHSWSDRTTLMSSNGASDHPQIVKRADQRFIAWHTELEGYRIELLD